METRPTGNAPRRTRAPRLAVFALLAVVAAACGEAEEATGDPLEGSSWEMTSVWDGTDLVPANLTTIATAVFADGTAAGSDGCNRYRFTFSVGGNSISFGDLAQTGSACHPDYAGQSDAFIQAMQGSERFVLTAESLELTDANGVAQLVFRPTTELPLVGVAWQLAWYGEGTSPLDGTEISLAFRTDGTLGGVAGCNNYSADYQIDGNQLVIGTIAYTEMACPEPDGVMAQEQEYLTVIQQTEAFTTTLTGLELLDTDGRPIAEYRFTGRTR